jgi:membrane-associated protease RseP (regulator of RpoE activity)
MDQFVCVRAVQMWGADLARFQFQAMLTWAVFFLNADGTIYGRYGSRGQRRGMRDNDKDVSLEGFKKAVQGALEVHKGFPANKASLAAKTGPTPIAKTPEELPGAAGRPNAREAKPGTHGCIHCHNVQDWEMISVRKAGQPITDKMLWPYPLPDQLGLSLDVRERATVAAVAAGSPAEKGGFKAGDRILALEGQPLISIADVQWVLHHAPEPSVLKAEVDRGGRKAEVTLALAAGWRRAGNLADTQSLGWVSRQTVAGMKCDALGPEEKKRLGLAEGGLALRIADLTPEMVKDRNPSARKIGLQKGDVIVEVDGAKSSMTETEFLVYLVQKKKPGQKVELTYLRGGAETKVQLEIP